MTRTDKCHVMSVANDIGAKYFENKEISPDMQIGALRAIRELVDIISADPEDDYSLDPLTGEKRWP